MVVRTFELGEGWYLSSIVGHHPVVKLVDDPRTNTNVRLTAGANFLPRRYYFMKKYASLISCRVILSSVNSSNYYE